MIESARLEGEAGGGKQIGVHSVRLAAMLVALLFFAILATVAWLGWRDISLSFILEEPRNGGRSGGILPIIASTALLIAICVATACPISIGAGVLLAEYLRRRSGITALLQVSLNVLASVPSIVFGIFGSVLFCRYLGFGYSLLSGGLTLACMILPFLIRAVEESCRTVPMSYRLAGAALGLSRETVTLRIILPYALPGIVIGLLVGISRALAETAALLFTSGYVDRFPRSIMDSGRSLSVHILDLAMNIAGGYPRAATTTLVLVVLLLLIDGAVLWCSRTLTQYCGITSQED